MSIIKSSKEVTKSVLDKEPKNRKTSISNVNNSDYLLDLDFDLPTGTILLRDKTILTQYAGDNYGFICSPREKQSVVVAPVDGNYDRAIVLGRIFDSDKERIPYHNLGDTLFRHQLGSQWSFTYSQPITGSMNLDFANKVEIPKDKMILENDAFSNYIKFEGLSLTSGNELMLDSLVRIVLHSADTYVEWEDRVKYRRDDQNKVVRYIQIDNSNTIIGRLEDYSKYKNSVFQAMLVSPPKGVAQFSHYTGMGLFMDEYPSRVPAGKDESGYLKIDENGNLASFPLNSDSFLNDNIDEYGRLNDFARGSLILKHYSDSGLYILEKMRKTYPSLEDKDHNKFFQSSIGVNLVLIRPTPFFETINGLNDDEKPLGSFIMEDDCKNALYNSIHIRIAQDTTGSQAITEEEIKYFEVKHRNVKDKTDLLEYSLPGTRPSRLQFYDLKRKSNKEEEENSNETLCIYARKKDNLEERISKFGEDFVCFLNYKKVSGQYEEVPDNMKQATPNSGKEDIKTGKRKCPCWPGCSEGHFTNDVIDSPLSVRNEEIYINNIPLLIKPKANLELAHYTGSGLFIEEQLPYNDDANYKKYWDVKYDDVPNYHAPNITLRLREWNYLPFMDESNDEINYNTAEKNKAFEPKRYDSCILEFDTIFADRTGKSGKGSYEFDNGDIKWYNECNSYKTAHKITLAQKLYGNWINVEEDKTMLYGNRLVFEDLLDKDSKKPLSVWGITTSEEDHKLEGTEEDTRVIMPKGKLELFHYTNSGLLIEEKDLTTAENDITDYSTVGHKMNMSLMFNYWALNTPAQNGLKEYRPVDFTKDNIDPMSIMRWEEKGELFPAKEEYRNDATSAVDWYMYLNAHRSHQLTIAEPKEWWNGNSDASKDDFRNGAYIAIRESDNLKDDSAPRAPIIEIMDTKNSIKMNPTVGAIGSQIDITNRETQFTNEAEGVNRVVMNAISQVIAIINGQNGGAYDATAGGEISSGNKNNSIVMDRTNKFITIQDFNDNKITINDKGIKIEEKVTGNTITIDSKGILIEDSNGNIVTMASAGIKFEDANSNKIEMTAGKIKVEAAANVEVKGANIKVDGAMVTITGGVLKTKGNVVPDMNGPHCFLKACTFSGSPHSGSMVTGT